MIIDLEKDFTIDKNAKKTRIIDQFLIDKKGLPCDFVNYQYYANSKRGNCYFICNLNNPKINHCFYIVDNLWQEYVWDEEKGEKNVKSWKEVAKKWCDTFNNKNYTDVFICSYIPENISEDYDIFLEKRVKQEKNIKYTLFSADPMNDKYILDHPYEINGNEFFKFTTDSTPFSESYNLFFHKDDKRMLKNIKNMLDLAEDVLLKRLDFKTFRASIGDRVLFEAAIFDDNWKSDEFKNDIYEENIRKNKFRDIKEALTWIINNHRGKNKIIIQKNKINNFTAVHWWLKEHEKKPWRILERRIYEAASYCAENHIKSIRDNPDLQSYIVSYLDTCFKKTLNDPDSFNFFLGLRLRHYLTVQQIEALNYPLKFLLKAIRENKYINYNYIKNVKIGYEILVGNMLDYIDNQLHLM